MRDTPPAPREPPYTHPLTEPNMPETLAPDAITGLVLAGGRGSRMGGSDKGLQPFRGLPLAMHALLRLQAQVGMVMINANRNLAAYEAFGVPVWPDADPLAYAGPLAGFATGLTHCDTPWLLTVPCDCPLFPPNLAQRLGQGLADASAEVAMVRVGGRTQPVFCLLRADLLESLSRFLDGGGSKIDAWTATLNTVEVDFDHPGEFENVNSLPELRALEQASLTPSSSPAPTVRSSLAMSASPSTLPPDLAQVVSCVSGYDPKALPVDKVQDVIRRFVRPVRVAERVDLRAALGRVLAEDVIAPMDVPAHNNSGMDGYALRSDDLGTNGATTLRIAGTGLAGHEFSGDVPAGSCLRIMTGAVLPAGCDTVVPQEFCRVDGELIHIPPGVLQRGDNARMRGEDLRTGQPALPAGKLLRPADIGLIASLGQAEVMAWRRLRVAFLSSGDELRSIGQPLSEGCVYDSNRYTLWAMLQRLGCDVLDLGVVRDDPALLEAALRHACENADAVITSGGVSVGEADHLRSVMAALGDVAFWRIAMRPGRPMAFGSIASHGQRAVLFGLPGNPVAVMVTFYAFVRDALLHMMGAAAKPLPLLPVAAQTALRKRPGRTEYQRAVLTPLPDQPGRYCARTTGDQGSGILRSMSEADGFIVLRHEQGSVQAGETVEFLPFEGLV